MGENITRAPASAPSTTVDVDEMVRATIERALKPGQKTTEFLGLVGAFLLTVLDQVQQLRSASPSLHGWSLLGFGLAAAGYAYARARVKAAAISTSVFDE